MKKALTTRQKTIQMLLDRWRKKQDEKGERMTSPEALMATPLLAQKPRIKISKTRKLPHE
jgi:hypothetical protein